MKESSNRSDDDRDDAAEPSSDDERERDDDERDGDDERDEDEDGDEDGDEDDDEDEDDDDEDDQDEDDDEAQDDEEGDEDEEDEDDDEASRDRSERAPTGGSRRVAAGPGFGDRARGGAARAGAADGGSRVYLYALVALVAGAAIGWFVRDHRAKAGVEPDTDSAAALGSAAPAGSASGPCADWAQALCKQAGPQSEACGQARSAAELLPVKACAAAMSDVPATVAKLKQARSSCDALVKKLCDELGKDTQTCKMVTERTPSFPAQRCKDMLDNYAQVVAELKKIEKQNAPLSAELAAKQAAGDGPSFGPADAKVVIVEYSDFECPYCARAAQVVEKLRKRYGSVVRFVFRQFPLPMHQNAAVAAEAALEAHAQGKFWPLHDLLFANSRKLDRESLEGYAKEVGLDLEKFNKALDEHSHAAEIKADQALGDEVGVSGTPTMFVGTERIANPTDYAGVSSKIDEQLKAAGVAVPAEEP